MSLELIHTYLIHPSKGSAAVAAGGTEVPLTGKLHRMLNDVYEAAPHECNIDIAFNPGPNGAQVNACRDLVIGHLRQRNLLSGRALAERLGSVTTKRSGLGLMFLLIGMEDARQRIVLSRFPAHSAIWADENQAQLNVSFLERVFMKSAFSYKSAVYEHGSLNAGFWSGRVVDKQVGSSDVETADYWVKEFLDSGFQTTDAMGTRRMAKALREAVRKAPDLDTKQAIASAVTLAGAMNGQVTSVDAFLDRFALPEAAREVIRRELPPDVPAQVFRFDGQEFATQIPYRSMELNTGVILTAPADEFNDAFETEVLDRAAGRVRISTEGRVVTERIEKR